MPSYFAEQPLEIDGLGSLKALTLQQQEDLKFEIHKYAAAMAKDGLDSEAQGKASSALSVHVMEMTFMDQARAVVSSPMILATAVRMMLGGKESLNSVAAKLKPPMLAEIVRHVYSSYGLELVPASEKEESDENPPIAAGSSEG